MADSGVPPSILAGNGTITVVLDGHRVVLDVQEAERHAHAVLDACERARESTRARSNYTGKTLILAPLPATPVSDMIALAEELGTLLGRALTFLCIDDPAEIEVTLDFVRRSPWCRSRVRTLWADGGPAL